MKGLTSSEVEQRILEKKVNYDTSVPTKTIPRIIIDNVLTLFNFLNFGLALLVFSVGSYKNLMFLGVVICNTIISTFQEIRSKKVIDKLSVISKNKVKVIRDNKLKQIEIEEIVLDDLIVLKPGDQVVVDSVILDNEVLVDESFITGESENIKLKKGDTLKSGSFITVGNCKARVIHVGEENYTSVISKDAKYIKKVNSVLMKSLNQIIKIVSIIIVPMGILLFINQYKLPNSNIEIAIVNTVAGLISMIPEGLILLTSTVLAVSIIKLSKYNVLVQELYCVEMLARVDTICLDKTGTITTGKMKVKEVIKLKDVDVNLIVGNMLTHLNDDNDTLLALKEHFKKQDNFKVTKVIPFSPVYKYSGVCFEDKNYYIGAPEFICDEEIKEINNYSKNRLLLLTEDKKPLAIIVLEDEIRPSAYKTFEYFKKQNVDIKIISGDSILTISEIASRVGLENVKSIDVSKLSDDELKESVSKYNIFGRVSPIQKKKMVKYLKENNHIVAMTGDGVNDVLALKEADCSIALASGTDAARNVSQLILLDSNFDSLPKVVLEGRRTINNIERSASLFVTKTMYAFLLSLLFIFVNWKYPFEPIQLTLIGMFTIGIPSFVLALEPNNDIISGNFLTKIFTRAIPASVTIALNIVIISILNVDYEVKSTLCTLTTAFVSFLLLIKISKPLNKLRISLFILMLTGFTLGAILFNELFSFVNITKHLLLFLILCTTSIISFMIINFIVNKIFKGEKK